METLYKPVAPWQTRAASQIDGGRVGEHEHIRGTTPDGTKVTLAKTQPQQLALFRQFLPDDPRLSNTIDLYDSIPKYFASPRKMDYLRHDGKYLSILEREFLHRNQATGEKTTYKVEVRPARLKTKTKTEDGSVIMVEKEFYPTGREELVEEALRKLATDPLSGVYLDGSAGVQFTLYQLQKELAAHGHSITLGSLKEALAVCHYSKITVSIDERQKVMSASIFPVLLVSTRDEWLESPKDARYYVQFNPLVTHSLKQITYRQYDYAKFMKFDRQLSRWIHKRLSHNYIQASYSHPYTIKASTIITNSGLVQNQRFRDCIKATDIALLELKDQEVLMSFNKELLYDNSGRTIIDAKYTLLPSVSFVTDMKAANKRRKDILNKHQRESA